LEKQLKQRLQLRWQWQALTICLVYLAALKLLGLALPVLEQALELG